MKKNLLIVTVLAVAIAGAVFWKSKYLTGQTAPAPTESAEKARLTMTIFKSPSCACCDGYISYLKRKGVEVKTVITDDIIAVKEKNHVPQKLQACHTGVWSNYTVEGHVPFEAIQKLSREKPKIKGIALPGMPAGSPGMGGVKKQGLVIFSFSESSQDYPEFARI
jgi:hypothetical protein